MRGLRFTDIESKPYAVLDMTSLVVEEFRALVEPFEEEFQAHVKQWRLDGLPRKKRSYSTYKNCPLPTPEDRLLFILAYLKNNPLQTLHGCTFGLPQCSSLIRTAAKPPRKSLVLGCTKVPSLRKHNAPHNPSARFYGRLVDAVVG